MTEWTLHFDLGWVTVCDLADKMNEIERAFTDKSPKYKAGTDPDRHDILLEYDAGTATLWLYSIEDEDVPRILAILSPLHNMDITQVSTDDGFRKRFNRFSTEIKEHPWTEIIYNARRAFGPENPNEVKCFKAQWEAFKAIYYEPPESE